MDFRKLAGKHHRFSLCGQVISPNFNINDTGYIDRANKINLFAWYGFMTQEPIGFTRRTRTNVNFWSGWNYDGIRLMNGIELNFNLQFLNYWWCGFGGNYNPGNYNDMDTRGGPLIYYPAQRTGWIWAESDERQKFQIEGNLYRGASISANWWYGGELELNYRPAGKLETSLFLSAGKSFDESQWVDNIDDINDSTHYVFGRLHYEEWKLTTRLSYNFTRDLSLQVYLQPFNAIGNYGEYVELAQPATHNFHSFDPGEDYDFNWKEFHSNVVFRWEYAPGSTIFLVWNRGMTDDRYPGRFSPMHNFQDLMLAQSDNVIMLKVNKWLDF
jgi:hypothetical protein